MAKRTQPVATAEPEDIEDEIEDEEEEEELTGVPETPLPPPRPRAAPTSPPRPAPARQQVQSQPYKGPSPDFERARQRMDEPPPADAPQLRRTGWSPDGRSAEPQFGPYPALPPRAPQAEHQHEPPPPVVDFVFGPVAAKEQEQRPMLEGKTTRLYVEVHREQFREDDGTLRKDEEGYLGTVENSHEWLDTIKRRYGGGHYKLVGLFDGRPFERKVKIAGPSLEPDEDDYEEPVSSHRQPTVVTPPWAQPSRPPWAGPQQQQQQPPWAQPQQPPWAQPSRPPWAGPDPQAGGGGRPPWGHTPYPTPQRDDELDELKERLAAAEEVAAREREERRVEQAEAKALQAQERFERAIGEQNRKFEMLIAAGQDKGGGAMDQMIQMMTLQMQTDKMRQEREAVEAKQRMEVEAERRRDDEKDRERSYGRRQGELDKQREAEREQARLGADRDREFWGKMMEYNSKGQQKPKDMIELLAAAQAMNPKTDPTQQITAMIGAFASLKDAFDGGGNQSSAAENIVNRITDGVQGVAEAYLGKREAPRQVDPQQMHAAQMAAAQQRLSLPGPGMVPTNAQVQALVDYRQRQAALASQMEAQGVAARDAMMESADRAPTGEEWGIILQATMDAYSDEREPQEFMPELHALIVQQLQVPKALELLEGATVTMLRLKLPRIKADIPVANPYHEKVILFEDYLINDEEGRAWLAELLEIIHDHQSAVRETAYQAVPHDRAPAQDGGWTGPVKQRPQLGPGGYPQQPYPGGHPQQDYPQAPQGQHGMGGYPQPPQGYPQQEGYYPQQQQQQAHPGYQVPMMTVMTPWGPRQVPAPIDPRVQAVDEQPAGWRPNAAEREADAPQTQAAYGPPVGQPLTDAVPPRPPSGAS